MSDSDVDTTMALPPLPRERRRFLEQRLDSESPLEPQVKVSIRTTDSPDALFATNFHARRQVSGAELQGHGTYGAYVSSDVLPGVAITPG